MVSHATAPNIYHAHTKLSTGSLCEHWTLECVIHLMLFVKFLQRLTFSSHLRFLMIESVTGDKTWHCQFMMSIHLNTLPLCAQLIITKKPEHFLKSDGHPDNRLQATNFHMKLVCRNALALGYWTCTHNIAAWSPSEHWSLRNESFTYSCWTLGSSRLFTYSCLSSVFNTRPFTSIIDCWL